MKNPDRAPLLAAAVIATTLLAGRYQEAAAQSAPQNQR